MPELPEVETLRRSLEPLLIGQVVERVEAIRPDVVRPRRRGAPRLSRPEPVTPRRLRTMLLEGCRIDRLDRHGKQLAIIAQHGSPVMVVHLGMTGQLLFLTPNQTPARDDHIHVRWRLGGAGGDAWLLFRDPRRFGRITPVQSEADLIAEEWSRLGPDALAVRAADLAARLAATSRCIKAALLDQGVVAGVGNIYADEALHRARLHPCTRSDRLERSEVLALAEAIRTTLRRSVRAGGTTLRDYVDGNGRGGTYRSDLRAYDRAGLPCRRCGRILVGSTVAQRTTTHCPHCQPTPPSTTHPHRG